MSTRPAPGQQLAAGRLRVDASKAIAKLREYQLVDSSAWVLEAIRAAVAAGATSIDLQGDSNDVWLSWTGAPWPAEVLPRLFDELVSPEPGAAHRHIRLLASAVNAALGANPAYIDVYSISDIGTVRVRYTPDVLDATAHGELPVETALQRVQAVSATPPRGASTGMFVHYRRRTSLEVVSYWLRREPPRELGIASSACADIATPVRIGGTVHDRANSTHDIARVSLGDDLDGFLAVTDATRMQQSSREVPMGVAEHGVLLQTISVDLDLPPLVAPIPIRMFVDGPRMPTNASRSEVRRDDHPISTAARRAKERLPDLVAELAKQLAGATLDERARHAAICLVASAIAGPDWANRARELEPPLGALAELPLVRDAAGAPRPIRWPWNGLVHTGSEPLSDQLAPWLTHVLWAPPDDATLSFATWFSDPRAMRSYLRTAKRERRVQRRFYKHAPRPASVQGGRKPRVRARLGAPLPQSCIPDDMFAGLTGEVCVYPDRPGGELTILLEGRELETIEYATRLSFRAVIDSAQVTPKDRFRAAVRDDAYARLERVMQAGVLRALEAVALANENTFVEGYHVAVQAMPDVDSHLVRDGLLLARNLGASLSAPLARAPVWRTSRGHASLAELQSHAVLGIVPAHATVPPLAERVLVYADAIHRAMLADVLPGHLVPYTPDQLAARIDPEELAAQVAGTSPHAFAVRDGAHVVAMLPAEQPAVVVFHRGVMLGTLPYQPALAPCLIAIDSDDVVPDPSWKSFLGTPAGAASEHAHREARLAAAIVSAITGDRPPELIGADPVELGGVMGRWLCTALVAAQDPRHVLDEESLARLRCCALFRVLGEDHAFSMDELAVTFPEVILFVETAADSVAGFPVVVADNVVARTISKVIGRRVRAAGPELERRRAQLARDLRLGMHRAKPKRPLEAPYGGTSVALASPVGRGVVGVGKDTFELHILVEGRPFQTIVPAIGLPLAAVVELDSLDRIDPAFEAVLRNVVEQLIEATRACTPELVRKLAEAEPEVLGDAGPSRALLAAWLSTDRLPADVRDELARTVKFQTLFGPRATVIEARRGPTILTSGWHGDWLVADGDIDRELDRPILQVSDSTELANILEALGETVDVTASIDKLQARRRIVRGLLPTPKVKGARPELTRRLVDLGTSYQRLGPGEVALWGGAAFVVLHAQGEPRERVLIECSPSIQLAIEAAELVGDRTGAVQSRIGADARALAIQLARETLATRPAEALPVEVRRSLREAILAKHLDARDARVFETTTGAWIDLATMLAQRDLFGALWFVAAIPADATPLDERRIVLLLSGPHAALAAAHGIPVVEATAELALDAMTRKNRARVPATSLAIEVADAIGKAELTGDGVTAPRGTVIVLGPHAAALRGLRLHRGMHPFDEVADPCRWPTLAVIDDARLAPNRTWDAPERDQVHKQVIDAVRKASNAALDQLVTPPSTALASMRITDRSYDFVGVLRTTGVELRGALWLAGPPVPDVSPTIRVIDGDLEYPLIAGGRANLAGTIYVHAPKGWGDLPLLEELCERLCAELVCELSRSGRRDRDVVDAHVAWALALGHITPQVVESRTFSCFVPTAIDADALIELLRSTETVAIVAPGSAHQGFALVDDGSETARVLKDCLGPRLVSPGAGRHGHAEPPPSPPIHATPIIEHPLHEFVNRLHARISALGIAVPAWRIVDRSDPIVRYEAGALELGAEHRHVLEIAAACAVNTAWSSDILDALAAHCITVLNVALTSITDAAEGAAIGRLLA